MGRPRRRPPRSRRASARAPGSPRPLRVSRRRRAALRDGDLTHDARTPRSRRAYRLGVACEPERAVADQAGAEERRRPVVRVGLRHREAEALVGYRELRIAAVDVVPGEACRSHRFSRPERQYRHSPQVQPSQGRRPGLPARSASLRRRPRRRSGDRARVSFRRELAVHDVEVGAADAARTDAEQHLSGPGSGSASSCGRSGSRAASSTIARILSDPARHCPEGEEQTTISRDDSHERPPFRRRGRCTSLRLEVGSPRGAARPAQRDELGAIGAPHARAARRRRCDAPPSPRRPTRPSSARSSSGRVPPGHRAALDASAKLPRLLPLLPARDPCAVRQLERDLDRPHRSPLERLLGDVRRQPARVLEDELHRERPVADRLGPRTTHLRASARRGRGRARSRRPHLVLEPGERRVVPEADDVPAAELDRPELGVLERVPVDALSELVGELDQREVVVRVLADPVDEVVAVETGGAGGSRTRSPRRTPRGGRRSSRRRRP